LPQRHKLRNKSNETKGEKNLFVDKAANQPALKKKQLQKKKGNQPQTKRRGDPEEKTTSKEGTHVACERKVWDNTLEKRKPLPVAARTSSKLQKKGYAHLCRGHTSPMMASPKKAQRGKKAVTKHEANLGKKQMAINGEHKGYPQIPERIGGFESRLERPEGQVQGRKQTGERIGQAAHRRGGEAPRKRPIGVLCVTAPNVNGPG